MGWVHPEKSKTAETIAEKVAEKAAETKEAVAEVRAETVAEEMAENVTKEVAETEIVTVKVAETKDQGGGQEEGPKLLKMGKNGP